MKFALAAALGSLVLAGCAGPEGNPNGLAYADEPGGAIAVAPQTVGKPLYDPNAPEPAFEDLKAGGAGAGQPSPTNDKPVDLH